MTTSDLLIKLDKIYYGFVDLYSRYDWKLNQLQVFHIAKKWLDLMVTVLDHAGFTLEFTIKKK